MSARPAPDAILTTAQAAATLGITPGRVRQLISAGALAARKAGRDHLISARDLESARARRGPGRPKSIPA